MVIIMYIYIIFSGRQLCDSGLLVCTHVQCRWALDPRTVCMESLEGAPPYRAFCARRIPAKSPRGSLDPPATHSSQSNSPRSRANHLELRPLQRSAATKMSSHTCWDLSCRTDCGMGPTSPTFYCKGSLKYSQSTTLLVVFVFAQGSGKWANGTSDNK